MGKNHVAPELEKQTLDVLEITRDCIDAANDLNAIECVFSQSSIPPNMKAISRLLQKPPDA